MTMKRKPISRREFIRLSGLAAGSLFLPDLPSGEAQPRLWQPRAAVEDFPDAEYLARAVGNLNVRARPDIDSPIVTELAEDQVVPWIREVIGHIPVADVKRWVETPVGYVWAPNLQPVRNLPNQPETELIPNPQGAGMWVQVTVPWVEVSLEAAQPLAYWLEYRMYKDHKPIYLYYDQIFWVDQIRVDSNGQTLYRLSELYGSYGDVFWGPAEAFRKITPEEVTPLSTDVNDKLIKINLRRQSVSAFENGREVYFCRASTGLEGEETETPAGDYNWIWRKTLSIHMGANTVSGGYDTPGIGYASFFISTGIALHATFWHNAYGTKRSHGCVNLRPDDAKWFWRWTTPYADYFPGDVTVTDYTGTVIQVLEN